MDTKVAIVTGACGGIGSAIVARLLQDGVRVIGVCRPSGTSQDLLDILPANLENLRFTEIDITQPEDIARAVSECVKVWGRIDILVNNAGVPGIASVLEVTEALWDLVFSVNVRATFVLIQSVIPYMIQQQYGRIINISSQAGKVGQPHNCVYSASKAAVIGLTQSLAAELGLFHITVNAVCPGDIRTVMMRDGVQKYSEILKVDQELFVNTLLHRIPVGRFGEPKDVANLVAFLASEESGYITGASLPVTGGLTMF